ncbi:MAG: glycosyltransferase family 4 protein [Methylococcaceae bacterium]|nr:glycosyltransferase family 4 protein [Methylococcaceae bacterium]
MIYLDLTIFSIQKMGGISVVWSEYLKRLNREGADLDYILLYPDNDNRIASETDLSNYNIHRVKPRTVVSKYLPFFLLGNKKDVLHTSYYQWYPFFRGTKIVTLHDFMHEKFAPFKSRILHNILKFISLRSADVILCISEATKNDLKEIYPGIFSKKDVRVIENSANDIFYPDIDYSEHNNDFLWVAGRSGYKNFKYALNILHYLKKINKNYKLSVVGPVLTDDEIEYAKSLGVLSQIQTFSNVSMEKLRAMYSNALGLLYLSKYEGFGLPILEAQKCLCPVIALKNPASLEVGKDTLLYINDESEEEIMDIINKIENDKLREKVVTEGLKNTKRYNWDGSVTKLVDVYSEYSNK